MTCVTQLENTHTHRQKLVPSLTHHRVSCHRHAGSVGQVVEDVGWFRQQVAAKTQISDIY